MRMATLVGRVGIGEKEYPRARLVIMMFVAQTNLCLIRESVRGDASRLFNISSKLTPVHTTPDLFAA